MYLPRKTNKTNKKLESLVEEATKNINDVVRNYIRKTI